MLSHLVGPLQATSPQPTEVVLHDLRRIPNTVRAIAGDVTGRKPGDPPTDKLLQRIAAGQWHNEIGYHSLLPDGRTLRCTTIVFTDNHDQPAAALCINTDISSWLGLRSSIEQFIWGAPAQELGLRPDGATPEGAVGGMSNERFPRSVEELSAHLIDTAIASIGLAVDDMRREHKIDVVAELERQGFFLVKQAAETAATALNVTRFTIYNYLNEIHDSGT
ncbi:transcriptional regulator [Paenarthrobacter sp. NPDC089675]|uniref:helix-turn-helix transcriptional regulator n=1 Tax=Paenarthrobacter sp. NPDC089675 TaxID=3364376 RepID=UPI00380F66E9